MAVNRVLEISFDSIVNTTVRATNSISRVPRKIDAFEIKCGYSQAPIWKRFYRASDAWSSHPMLNLSTSSQNDEITGVVKKNGFQ
jgi:hypothetical protein